MKKLIVSGDSNTDSNFESMFHPDMNNSYKKWPELLGKKLGMEVVNMARSGAGNEYIYTSLRNKVVDIKNKSEIGLVIAAWSQATRRDLEVGRYGKNQPWTSLRIDTHGNLIGWVNKTLGHYLDFQILCERFNLPYFHFQTIDIYEHYLHGYDPTAQSYSGDKEKDEKDILENIKNFKIDTSKFMGWPPVKKLGGFRLHDLDEYKENNISELDNHPNKQGQEKIAEIIYEKINS
jgi:hypothetical protein